LQRLVAAALSPNSGTWRAFAQSTDGGGYQISGYQIQAGDSFTLKWYGNDGWNASVETINLLSAAAQNTPFASTGVLATRSDALGGWTEYTLNYTAAVGDAGNYVGISFINSKGTAGSWAAFDDFSLTVTPVPEPGALDLLGLGSFALIAARRRRSS